MRPGSKCRTRIARLVVPVLALACLVVAQAGTAVAAPPANDDFANATPISALPFSDSGDLNGTTVESGEPQHCDIQAQTVWYAFTPIANTVVKVDLDGSDPFNGFNVYRSFGTGFGDLQFLGCIGSGGSFSLTAQAGSTYYIQVGSATVGAANLQFRVQEISPPPNDDFANATQVTTVPFSDTVEHLIAATLEPNEPFPCAGGDQRSSVWWAFTPTTTGSYTAHLDGPLSPGFTVYTGSSLTDLQQVACSSGEDVTFQGSAGTTYYLRAAGAFDLDFPMFLRFDVTPEPVAGFFFIPSDPSVFDIVQFHDSSSDPAEVGIQSQAWTFGDGATAEGCCPTHQYARDGDYTVGLTVTTPDGRTASTSQVVEVRTHDVAVARVSVPKSANVGQTIAVNVEVRNTRYPETVLVDLFRGDPGSFQQVGSLTQLVPVRPGNRTMRFPFTYTVTEADRAVGKISFTAVATTIEHRDAAPADNELTSPPTRIV